MLILPATPRRLLHEVIQPALAAMPVRFDTPAARCMLLAIALQEGGALLAGRQPLRRQGAQLRAAGNGRGAGLSPGAERIRIGRLADPYPASSGHLPV